MPESHLDRIIREKLIHLNLPPRAEDWTAMEARLEAAFDAALRAQLAQASLPLPVEEWEAFAATLDAAFDAQVRDLLHAHEVILPATDWPLMAALLSPYALDAQAARVLDTHTLAPEAGDWEALAAQLDTHPLDTQVRVGLVALEAAAETPDWEDMAHYLDDAFDASLRERLAAHAVPLVPAHWQEMAARLDQYPVDTLVREGLTDHRISPLMHDWLDMIHRLEAPFDAHIREKLASHLVGYRATDWRHLAARLAGGAEAVPLQPIRRYLVAAAIALLLLFTGGGIREWVQVSAPLPDGMRPALSALPPVTSPPAAAPVPVGPDGPALASLPPSPAPPPSLALGAVRPLPDRPAILSPVEVETEAAPVPKWAHPLRPLRHTPVNQAFAFSPRNTRGLDLLDPMGRRPAPELRLSFYGANAGTKAELNAPNRGPGFTTGLRLEMKINEGWSVVTGLLYSQKSFAHRYPVLRDNLPEWGRLEGDLSLIEAPLLLRYNYPLSHKLRAYGQFGLITTVSLAEHYTDFNPNDPANATASRRAAPEDLRPNELSWSLNTYPGNVQVAVGLEYAFTKRIALQVEPYFQQSLQRTKGSASLGFQKKLYTTGIATALVFRLNTAE